MSVSSVAFSPRPTLLTPLDKGYEAQSGKDKQAALWSMITAAPYPSLPPLNSAGVDGGKGFKEKLHNLGAALNVIELRRVFTADVDLLPRTSYKAVHAFGTAAEVTFTADPSSPYTGLLASGAPGIVRLSAAHDPAKGMVPGVAIKLFVDGAPSQDALAIPALDAQKGATFFSGTPSTKIPKPKSLQTGLLGFVFALAKRGNPLNLPVSRLGSVTASGDTAIAAPRTPARLLFVPTAEAQKAVPGTGDFRAEIAAIPVGTALYEVYGQDDGKAPVHVGTVTSSSAFVASELEDKSLIFKHEA